MKLATTNSAPSDAFIEFRELVVSEGGLHIELRAEDDRISSAHIGDEALADMQLLLGLGRSEVRSELETALAKRFEQDRAQVQLAPPVLGAEGRLISRYVNCGVDTLEVGIVWHDVSSDTIGPRHVPAIVRSRMRQAIAYLNAQKARGVLGRLIDILEAASY